jgi:dTDP-4-dehydrorhamnose 3,5-epimerase
MKFIPTALNDVFIIELEMIRDYRGFFARSWCKDEFRQNNLSDKILQCNISFNLQQATIRGMHFQTPPYQETKIVRCISGDIYDVIIDLRDNSTTYMNWMGVNLNSENRNMLYIPRGFAHGYQTLTPNTEINYQVDQYYNPTSERGIRWNDPAFSINWPISENCIISEKDATWPNFQKP